MQEFLFLCVGLGVGLAIAGWQRLKLERAIERIHTVLPDELQRVSLSPLWKLRRGMSWYAERNERLSLDAECWRSAVMSAPLGYLQVDGDNYLQRANEAACTLLGLPERAAPRPRLLLELVRSYELDRLVEKTRKTQQPQTRFWTFHPTSDSVTEIERSQSLALFGRSVVLPNGQVGVWLENQQELVDLQEDRNRWVSDLAHELRTPLTSIKLVAENLEQRLESPMRNWVVRLIPETDRLITFVQDWLDLSKLESDRYSMTHQPVRIAQLMDDVWATLNPIANRRRITLKLCNCGPLTLYGNRDRLFQVFLNLLDNAVQHSPDGAKILTVVSMRDIDSFTTDRAVVSLLDEGRLATCDAQLFDTCDAAATLDRVTIDIIDSGPGFSETDLPRVFERLYRGDRSRARLANESETARHTGGHGLGLAIVEQIVRAHAGTIVARNVPDRSGAWLQVSLPSTPEVTVSPA